ncbi:hypothetical protein ABZ876_16460 [Streptomyces sp. NPDC046931]|uniref:hypothetical protein n=1 Tax=Streptomyces sp. NPDC046931 TaxID=3154806 RepID=UPI0033E3B95E
MSTTTTAESPEPRRRRRYTSLPGRTTQPQSAAGRGSVPSALPRRRAIVLDDAAEQRVLSDARRHGRKAAKRKVLDPWVLGSGDRVPYFAELASVRDLVIHRIGEELNVAEEVARLSDARAASDVTAGEAETRLLDQRLRETAEEIGTSRAQLDLLARRSSRWMRFRDGFREQIEERWLRARFPRAEGTPRPPGTAGDDEPEATAGPTGAAGEAPSGDRGPNPAPETEADGWQSVPAADAAPAGTADVPSAGTAHSPDLEDVYRAARAQAQDAASATAWEGLPIRPGLPGWMTWGLLGAICAVEIPIYWIAYQPFHGVGSAGADLMSGTLAISSAIAMVVAPHLAGRTLRWRAATGSLKAAWLPSLALLGVWGYLSWVLGTVRAKFVTQHEPASTAPAGTDGFSGLGSGTTDNLIDRLHLTSQTVTWLFCALLLLTGGIGFLLGLFREHPYLDAFRSALERRADLQRRREESIAATERARAAHETGQARQENRREAANERIASARQLYEAAAYAYLDGVMTESSDPAVTESAMKLSRTWPLLPSTVRHEAIR